MHRTMLSVIALAVGAIMIITVFNIYRPEVSTVSHDVFNKVHVTNMASSGPKLPQGLKNGYAINNYGQWQQSQWEWKPKGQVQVNGKSNQNGVWQLVENGKAYNIDDLPQGSAQAEINGSGNQLTDGVFANNHGQLVTDNQMGVNSNQK